MNVTTPELAALLDDATDDLFEAEQRVVLLTLRLLASTARDIDNDAAYLLLTASDTDELWVQQVLAADHAVLDDSERFDGDPVASNLTLNNDVMWLPYCVTPTADAHRSGEYLFDVARCLEADTPTEGTNP